MKYMVCEEVIDGHLLGFYFISTGENNASCRFIVHDSFDSYEEAQSYIEQSQKRDRQIL